MPSFYRFDGNVQTPLGQAVSGASIAVLTQPASFATQPGSPLATLYAANGSNAATIIGATWSGGQIVFQLSAPPPADIVSGSYIFVSSVNPGGYNSTLSAPWVVVSVAGNFLTVLALTNPGTYVSGGTVATSALPNPTTSDGNGNYFFYATAGIYSIQIYGEGTVEHDFIDQDVGTVSSGGTVTSVALTLPAEFSVAGSPITASGTLAVTKATQSANKVWAGPTTGAPAAPTFRSLVAADIPSGGTGTVTSVGASLSVPGILTQSVSGSPVTTTGVLALTLGLATQNANLVWAGPTSGGAAPPTFRALVAGDLPSVSSPYKVEFYNATAATINNVATEQTLMTFTLPANELGASQLLDIFASGLVSAGSGTLNFTVRLYLDAQLIVFATMPSIASGNICGWELTGKYMLATTGAGGTIEVQGKSFATSASASGTTVNGILANNAQDSQLSTFAAALSFDTTATHVIKVTGQMGSANAANSITQRQMLIARIG
jgi:hypothetical protein